ncbi:glycosyltransferase family 4 protein [Capnocytophaga canimorsus]|uniref:glycosyltransferase family 4 protein n=1 Tax=Capnocytophaga canimorsus TaxID=28188 RepID=UPI001562CE8C|nr:glycosyltransferase family 4 protein [Capnocytophaga canimorsus]
MKKKLWIVSELFYPDQTSTAYILSKIADKMVEKYDVSVIAGAFLYDENSEISKSYFELNDSIEIIRMKSKKRDKNKLLQRAVKLISDAFNFSKILWSKVDKKDKVLIVTNPAPLLIFISLIKQIKKFELTILVHDVFPENTIPVGIFKNDNSLIYKLILYLFNFAYSQADTLIVLGRDMEAIFKNKLKRNKNTSKIKIIENWADINLIIPVLRKPQLLQDRHSKNIVTIQYAGNIGRAQRIEKFIDRFNNSSNKNIHFDLWGNGAMKEELTSKVNELGLNDKVTFHGSFSRDSQQEVLNSTDLALVTLAEGMYGLGVPSKTYNILAAGIPILYIGNADSEIGLLVNEENIGYCFEPDDHQGIEEFLKKLDQTILQELVIKGQNARKLAEEKYSENAILLKYTTIL